MTEKQYALLTQELAPKSPMGRDCLGAFFIGGAICMLGQWIMNSYSLLGLDKDGAACATSMTLVTLSALLTGLSLYDDLAKYAGAGTLVPITGFANAIAAPAVEFKTDERDIIGLSQNTRFFLVSMMILSEFYYVWAVICSGNYRVLDML